MKDFQAAYSGMDRQPEKRYTPMFHFRLPIDNTNRQPENHPTAAKPL
ncbi:MULTISPECIES: hypothetical protein [Kingella]|uniref:Uncharacterized protein n=1 Tax=Kingella bonacorsii TaxID=2796361 RepID=A0ABS1BPC5_9NEIS|nr:MULTISPECIES: hypothetical protein [Kingella]MBK0395094.1 hypothetical protein [Kingella bonacorsii]